VVRHHIDAEVHGEPSEHPLGAPEGRVEVLPDEERYQQRALLDRRTTGTSAVLPTGEVVRQLADRLEAQPHPIDRDFVAAAHLLDLDRVGLYARLPGKVEYLARHSDFGSVHPVTSFGHLVHGCRYLNNHRWIIMLEDQNVLLGEGANEFCTRLIIILISLYSPPPYRFLKSLNHPSCFNESKAGSISTIFKYSLSFDIAFLRFSLMKE